MNLAVTVTSILWMLGYTTAVGTSGALMLWVQRRWFLHPDEDQSFALPGIAGFGVGILYLGVMVAHG